MRGFDGRHVGRVGVLGVAEDEGGRLRAQLREATDLGLVRHVRAGRAVRTTAVLQDDGRREVAGVFGHHLLQGCRVPDAAVDDRVGVFVDVEQAGHEGVLEAARLAVDDLLVAVGEVGQSVLVIDRGDRQGRPVGRGFRDRARVGVGRVRQPLAGVVGVGARVRVTGSRVDAHPGLGEVLVDLRVHGPGLAAPARVVAEGQVDRVGLDDDRVVEGGQHSAVRDRTVLVGGYLRDDDLGVGRGALQVGRVGSGDRGNMRAVGEILGGGGQHVRVVVGVIEDEGNLLVQVGTLLAVAQCADQGLDVLLRQADGHVIHGARECRVRGFDARVDDLNNLLVTLL